MNQDCCPSVTIEKTVKERRPLVNQVVRAVTEAIHYIKTNKEDTKAFIAKNLKKKRPRRFGAGVPRLEWRLSGDAYPNAEGVTTLLDDIAPHTPKPRQPIPRVS